MQASMLAGTPGLPVVVEPTGVNSLEALRALVAAEAGEVNRHLRETGAILFRGFAVRTPDEFQGFAAGLTEKFVDYKRGSSPRKKVHGQVYTSTEAPARIPIGLHCELFYVDHYPDRILFFCETEPEHGGETPICDMRAVYQAIDPKVRDRFEEHGIRIIQNVPGHRSWRNFRTWQEMFDTDDRAHVEAYCQGENIQCRWKSDGTLQLINIRPASIIHPVSGDRIWFNGANNIHDSWSWEFRRAGLRGLALLAGLAERMRRRRKHSDDYPNHCQYGDGTEIEMADITHVRQVLWDHAVLFPWKLGDVILLDNLRVAHGRMPFRGKRRILVAMGMSRTVVSAVA